METYTDSTARPMAYNFTRRGQRRPRAASPPGPHPHHWLIEEARGPTSAGVCRACGEVRTFRNSLDVVVWEGDPMAIASRMGAPEDHWKQGHS